MKKFVLLIISLLFIITHDSCYAQDDEQLTKEIPHYLRKDNFSVLRVIIMNSEDEILLVDDSGHWGMPWVNFTKRQFINEAIDSMALELGIEIEDIELRGQFCFKYDYKPNVTFRNYYVAQYKSGSIKIPKNTIESKFENIEWVKTPLAIERNGNEGIKAITKQIVENPSTVWGGSFMVSHTDDDHPTKMVEDFYSLFERK